MNEYQNFKKTKIISKNVKVIFGQSSFKKKRLRIVVNFIRFKCFT